MEDIVRGCPIPFLIQLYCQKSIHLGIDCLTSSTPKPMMSQSRIILKSPALLLSLKYAYVKYILQFQYQRMLTNTQHSKSGLLPLTLFLTPGPKYIQPNMKILIRHDLKQGLLWERKAGSIRKPIYVRVHNENLKKKKRMIISSDI